MSEPSTSAADPDPRDARISLLLAIMLATLGLMGALVAWRVGTSSDIAADSSLEGLIVTRDRAREAATAQGAVAQTSEAWLAYESFRRQADSLRADGFPDAALEAAKRGAAHYFLVRPEYLDEEGDYDPEAHLAAIMAEASAQGDLDPAPHFARVAAEETRIRNLLAVGILLAIALPLLTIAEVTGGRRRLVASAAGAAVFAVGTVAMVGVWL
jgi:hypothetical protein